jgi:hypothetical protein
LARASGSGTSVAHFTLWRLDGAEGDWDHLTVEQLETTVAGEVGVSLNGRTFGGWTVREGAGQYSGSVTNQATGRVVRLPGTFRYDG